jgi:hypothetical protein
MDLTFSDLTWVSLGAGATIGMALLIKEMGGDDVSSMILYALDLVDTPTVGGDFQLDFSATGNVSVNSIGA